MQEAQETWVGFLGWEGLEKGMAIHSSTLAWEIQWTEKPSGLQSMELQTVRHDLVTKSPTTYNGKVEKRREEVER